jgi:hypothetical protein
MAAVACATAGAVTALTVLSACSSATDVKKAGASASSSESSAASSAPPEPTVPPKPAAVSPAEFAQALANVDAAIAPGFTQLKAADTPKKLSAALDAAAEGARSAADAFEQVAPPEAAISAAGSLRNALVELPGDLGDLSTAASKNKVCTAASAVPEAAKLGGLTALRDAAAALAAVDPAYKVGTFAPAAQDEPSRQGSTGQLSGGQRGGLGELTVKNESGAEDALVKLTNGDKTVREIYVRGGDETTVKGIPDGTLTAYYATGTDWDGDAKKFTRSCAFQKFDDTLSYETTRTQYTTYSLTLYTIAGGNATISDIPPDQFPS